MPSPATPRLPRPKARVLHLAPYLWSGAGKVITALIERQCSRYDVSLVTTGPDGALRNWPEYERRLRASCVSVAFVDLFHRDPSTFWHAVEDIAELLAATRPHLVHAHAGVPTAAAVVARDVTRLRVPVISHVYSWGVNRPTWMNAMDVWAHRRADAVVCSARAYEKALRAAGVQRQRLHLVPWGIAGLSTPQASRVGRHGLKTAGRLASRPAVLADGAAPIVVGTVGRIEPRKNQAALVDAFAWVARSIPAARLELVGPVADHEYAAHVARRVDALGLRSNVTLVGHVAEPADAVRRWAMYVSLSQDEGQGLAVLEAMALGVPAAALVAPGVEDYLEHGKTGLALPNGTPRQVGLRLRDWLKHPHLLRQLGPAGARMVRRRYSWEKTMTTLDRLYGDVIASGPKRH